MRMRARSRRRQITHMNVADLYRPDVPVVTPGEPLSTAAAMLCEQHIGALVVIDPNDSGRHPIGLLTDRDIVRGQLERNADLYCLTVGDVMSQQPLLLPASLGLAEAVEDLNSRSVRRAPVVDASGALIGIVTLDELLPALARELAELAELMATHPAERRVQR
jgi:CBS domain-containing protein